MADPSPNSRVGAVTSLSPETYPQDYWEGKIYSRADDVRMELLEAILPPLGESKLRGKSTQRKAEQ